jgi:mRNA interferase MazF
VKQTKQGSIIKLDFNPTKGHEQAGYRPAVVISNDLFGRVTNLTLVCPITNTHRKNPLHLKLNDVKTTGFVMCDQLRVVDLRTRKFSLVETLSQELTERISSLIKSFVDVPDEDV